MTENTPPAEEQSAQPETSVDTPPTETAPEGPDLSFIPSDFVKDGAPDLGAFTEHYRELVAERAKAGEAAAEIPETYTLGLPEGHSFGDLDLPEDWKFEIAADDPAVAPLSEWFRANNVPQAQASQLMALYANMQASQASAAFTAAKEEWGKVRDAETRVARVGDLISKRLPEAQASAVKAMTTSAAALQALETLLSPASPRAANGVPAAGTFTEAMTAEQRLAAANAQMAQRPSRQPRA